MRNEAEQKEVNAIIGMGLSLILVGLFVAAFYVGQRDVPTYIQWIVGALAILAIPGLIIGFFFGRDFHDPNLVVAVIANWMFYSMIFYFIVKRRRRSLV